MLEWFLSVLVLVVLIWYVWVLLRMRQRDGEVERAMQLRLNEVIERRERGIMRKVLLGFVLSWVKKLIANQELKKRTVRRLNEVIDLPKLDEKQEEKVLSAVWDSAAVVIETIVNSAQGGK